MFITGLYGCISNEVNLITNHIYQIGIVFRTYFQNDRLGLFLVKGDEVNPALDLPLLEMIWKMAPNLMLLTGIVYYWAYHIPLVSGDTRWGLVKFNQPESGFWPKLVGFIRTWISLQRQRPIATSDCLCSCTVTSISIRIKIRPHQKKGSVGTNEFLGRPCQIAIPLLPPLGHGWRWFSLPVWDRKRSWVKITTKHELRSLLPDMFSDLVSPHKNI